MRKFLIALLPLLCPFVAATQTQPVKVAKKANHFVYTYPNRDEASQPANVEVFLSGTTYRISSPTNHSAPTIPGYSEEETFVDLQADSLFTFTTISSDAHSDVFLTYAPLSRADIQFDTLRLGGLTRYTCSINSNKLEFYVQDHPAADISPLPYYGRFKGLLVSFWRNGLCLLQLHHAERVTTPSLQFPSHAQRTTPRQLANIKRQRMVVANRLFDSVQLSWGRPNSHIDGDTYLNTPFDSVLHFAGGTLALKRLRLPHLPKHYQTFVEIHQRSNGDAYDRTGCLFVLPFDTTSSSAPSFFCGMNQHPDSLPTLTDRAGNRYQGIATRGIYCPPVELVRFFTSFGIGHFNSRVAIDGLEWQSENYYRQEVTELAPLLQGEVWVGLWIGNYDGGGHIVTVDLKSYPNDFEWTLNTTPQPQVISLFNTCNVLEMAGQNYGRLFATDSLSTTFYLPPDAHSVRLRYITTGHGGWDEGDEFTPKPNTILIDGIPAYTHTPWRCDCGRYRQWNPVSGNFWNGLSSSDLSRSGWCPGAAAEPLFVDLSHLSPGFHTLTVAIPQGSDSPAGFSHWCVSGALLIEP